VKVLYFAVVLAAAAGFSILAKYKVSIINQKTLNFTLISIYYGKISIGGYRIAFIKEFKDVDWYRI